MTSCSLDNTFETSFICWRSVISGDRWFWSVPSPVSTGVITLGPCSFSKGASRSQVPVDCHAPCTRTNVDMRQSLAGAELSVYETKRLHVLRIARPAFGVNERYGEWLLKNSFPRNLPK